jgi:protein phosphatase inhibitor 2
MANNATKGHHIKWDEETIALHDLDRGTRMKINEPNTPYHYYDQEADMDSPTPPSIGISAISMQLHDANPQNYPSNDTRFLVTGHAPVSPARSATNGSELNWEELEKKLKDEEEQAASNVSECDDGDLASSVGNDKRSKSFASKRKQHYNEYERMKQWREQHNMDDDEEDETS